MNFLSFARLFIYYFLKILDIFMYTVLAVAVLGLALVAAANYTKSETNQLGAVSMFIVLTNSMVPVFSENDAIFVINTKPQDLTPGDIITFYAFDEKKTIITHRIVSKEPSDSNGYFFKTKGDANISEDSFTVLQEDIIGKYLFKVKNLSSLMSRLKEKPYEIFIAVLVFLLLDFLLKKLTEYFAPNEKSDAIAEKSVEK